MRRWLIAVVLVTGAAGCGGAGKPVKVQGLVTLDGEPVAGATVTFTPIDGVGPVATGLTGTDGKFRLRTFTTNDGAVPGEYKVTITKSQAPDASDNPASDPKKMQEFMMQNMFKPKRGKKVEPSPIPKDYSSPSKTPLICRVPTDSEVRFELRKAGGS